MGGKDGGKRGERGKRIGGRELKRRDEKKGKEKDEERKK